MYFIYTSYKKMKYANKQLDDKHVLITGGSSGIGKALATLATKKGAHVTIIARDAMKLKNVEMDLKAIAVKETQEIKSISLDITNYDNVAKCLSEIDEGLPIYMLINCAGMSVCGKIENMSIEDTQKMFDINFFGTYYPIKIIVPQMKRRREGYIVITGSQASLLGIFGFTSYSASKFALRGFSEALDMEVRSHNINVTLAVPPDTDTPGFEKENLTKLEETKLISGSAGLYQPEEVAEKILADALSGKFMSCIGLESSLLTTLCVGMTRHSSLCEIIVQSLLLGPFRIISTFYLWSFHRIVERIANKKID